MPEQLHRSRISFNEQAFLYTGIYDVAENILKPINTQPFRLNRSFRSYLFIADTSYLLILTP